MPNIRIRKDGRYEARIYKGRSYSVYSKNKTELSKKIKLLEKQIKEKPIETKKEYTLNEWSKEWMETYKKPFVSQSTFYNINLYFTTHILPTLGKYKIDKISAIDIQKFFNNIKKSRTKEFLILYLKACLKSAYENELITKDPTRALKQEKKIRNKRDSFSINEQSIILKECKQEKEYYQIIKFYLLTGIRRNEIFNFEIKENGIFVNGTKTENSKRFIPLDEEYLKEINNIKSNCILKFKEDYITRKFKTTLDKLKIKGCIHSLRHTFATNNFYLGNNMKYIQEWLGHSSITITSDIYTNLKEEKDQKEKIKMLYNNLYYIAK